MKIDRIIQDCLKYAENDMVVSVSAAVILLFLLIKKPKVLLALVLIAIGAAGVLEVFDLLASTGLNRVK